MIINILIDTFIILIINMNLQTIKTKGGLSICCWESLFYKIMSPFFNC